MVDMRISVRKSILCSLSSSPSLDDASSLAVAPLFNFNLGKKEKPVSLGASSDTLTGTASTWDLSAIENLNYL